MKRNTVFTLCIAFVILLFSSAGVIAKGKPGYFVIIGAADTTTVTRCMQIVQMYHAAGNNVELFLMDDAVRFAIPGNADDIKTVTGDFLSDRLQYILDKGIPMCVCGPCADARGSNTADYPDGDIYKNASRCGGPQVVEKSNGAEVLTCF